ncbi:hypothetical protein KOR34_45510 [Posidoniimonas corsicana]|uniref:Uncharacterized protein n=1 Tax=Posidoniimonas corsicana TaxID=1938618 RepID=A0A5C5V0C4_9BACT|nr:hypothetical protein [Posidoniimonas corsicana]TWT31175.1 hypothetical protein KOR34_45510 [Posidoniimonas corsicana]
MKTLNRQSLFGAVLASAGLLMSGAAQAQAPRAFDPASLTVPTIESGLLGSGSGLRIARPTLGLQGVGFQTPSHELRLSDPTTRLGLGQPTQPILLRDEPLLRVAPETDPFKLFDAPERLRIEGSRLNLFDGN